MSNSNMSSSRDPFILFMDVNQNIILCDTATNVTAEQALQMTFADHSWGKVEYNEHNGTEWKLTYPQLSIEKPEISSSNDNENDELVSYSDYLDLICEETKIDYSLPKPEMHKRKLKRNQLRSIFITAENGSKGAQFRELYEKILEKQKIPQSILEEYNSNPSENSDNSSEIRSWHNGNEYFIQPAFYLLLIYLQHFNRKFNVIFRTFGEDLPRIAFEFNLFCEGKHPKYTQIYMDGSGRVSNTAKYLREIGINVSENSSGNTSDSTDNNNSIDHRLYESNCGFSYRTNDSNHLLVGVMPRERIQSSRDFPNDQVDLENFVRQHHYITNIDQLSLCNDNDRIHEVIIEKSRESKTMGLRDYFEYWQYNQRRVGTGKLFLINDKTHHNTIQAELLNHDNTDKSTSSDNKSNNDNEYNPITIFFDDSVHCNILDLRFLSNNSIIDNSNHSVALQHNCAVWHTRMIDLLQNEQYFIQAVEQVVNMIREAKEHKSANDLFSLMNQDLTSLLKQQSPFQPLAAHQNHMSQNNAPYTHPYYLMQQANDANSNISRNNNIAGATTNTNAKANSAIIPRSRSPADYLKDLFFVPFFQGFGLQFGGMTFGIVIQSVKQWWRSL